MHLLHQTCTNVTKVEKGEAKPPLFFNRIMVATQLFTTPLWVQESGLTDEELDHFEKYALSNEMNGEALKKSNNEFAFHTKLNFAGEFQVLPGAKKIANIFRGCLEEYAYHVKQVQISYWAIVSRKYAYNSRHNHGDCLLSSALYVNVPEKSGEIKFYDPRPAKQMASTIGMDKNSLQHQSIKVLPKRGMFVVFPSFLEHEVTMTMSETPRIVYSFNVTALAEA